MISRINNKNYSFQTYLHEATKKLQPYLFGIATTTKPIIRDVQKTEWFVWFSENWTIYNSEDDPVVYEYIIAVAPLAVKFKQTHLKQKPL